MLIIQDVLIHDDVVQEKFLCQLDACQGACCWEGDWGAPLEAEEIPILVELLDRIRPYLTPEGRAVIEEKGPAVYYEEPGEYGTALLDNGACSFLTYNALGIAQCGIEQAYNDGAVDFKKPISCHLYPIRIHTNPEVNFEALNYDRWDICSAACSNGAKAKLPLYRFAREALIRKYGEEFYEELDAAAQHLEK
ncbi:MAG: DUF3109 family protein [Bacteroidota bacterium]